MATENQRLAELAHVLFLHIAYNPIRKAKISMTRQTGQTLIFAVAQRAFEINNNLFSTLLPLIGVDGSEINARDFPNRGLAWWMVRGVPEIIKSRPGRLMVADVEDSVTQEKQDLDKDLYQVNYDTVQVAGPKRLLEIVTPEGHASMEPWSIINGATAQIDHEPTPFVLVRLGAKLYGPFKTEAEERSPRSGRYTTRFVKAAGDRPIYIFDQNAVPSKRLTAMVAMDDASPSRSVDIKQCTYELVLWNVFDNACNSAKTISLSTDEEVISRVAKEVLTKSKRQELIRQFKELRAAISGVSDAVRMEDIARVQEIALNLNRPSEALDKLVTAMLGGGFLDDEVTRATEAAAARAIGERTSTIRAEAEQQLKEIRHDLEARNKELATIDAELDRIRRSKHAEIEAEIGKKTKDAEQNIAEQQEAVDRQKSELDRQRHAIEHNLSSVVKRFQHEKDKLITDFLAISPILESVGVIRSNMKSDTSPSSVQNAEQKSTSMALPLSLAREGSRATALNEEEFFERFCCHVQDCGFTYRTIDLLSFHVSIKCSDLSIIGGVSGTGKSSLPRLYSQALAGDDHEQSRRFLPVDVSPAWTNPSDVLGYVNLLDRSFHPGASGLFTHMAWAAMEAEMKGGDSGIYLVCLDEMNLSHVEHYFSGFIQALSRAPGNRDVTVFDQASVSASDPASRWSRLPISDNVRFVGTVNFDETTKPISQRVLDRANLLQLDSGNLLDGNGQAATTLGKASGDPVRVNDVRSWINYRPLDKNAAQILEALQDPLKTLGCPLTPRRRVAIARFLGSAPPLLCTSESALDLQVAQRILPQIKGLFRQEARAALVKVRTILEKNESAFEHSLHIVRELQASEDAMEPSAWEEE